MFCCDNLIFKHETFLYLYSFCSNISNCKYDKLAQIARNLRDSMWINLFKHFSQKRICSCRKWKIVCFDFSYISSKCVCNQRVLCCICAQTKFLFQVFFQLNRSMDRFKSLCEMWIVNAWEKSILIIQFTKWNRTYRAIDHFSLHINVFQIFELFFFFHAIQISGWQMLQIIH